MTSNLIERGSVSFENISKLYGNVVAVDNVDFDIKPGQLVTLLGPSGCGKTTTLRIIAGLEDTSKGKIILGGKDVTHLTASYRNVSMVFQSYALFPHMSVLENVSYGLSLMTKQKEVIYQKALEGLKLVGLTGYGDRLPSELSGGQQQRVAVARAIVLAPEVLLLDEPLSNLDAKLRRNVRDEIRQIQQKLKLTTVYVTHDQEEAMAISDIIVVMKDGKIEQMGTPSELFDRPNSKFIADFICDANIVQCNIIKFMDDMVKVKINGNELDVAYYGEKKIKEGSLSIRPEAVILSKPKQSGKLQGKIRIASYLGSHMEYTIITDIGEILSIDHKMEEAYITGDEISINFKNSGVALVK